ncbi:MAG: DEAD/DEAH box helicase family protein, partial [Roseomonas sp.]|nr:DEAD/DEAH box helicase family protein [Roseomonas sp.]
EDLHGRPALEIIKDLGDLVYLDPVRGFVTRDEYLSGNVKAKLAAAREAARQDPAMQRNVTALEAVQPADIAAADIKVKPGAHWLPAADMKAFATSISGDPAPFVLFNPASAQWNIRVQQSPSAATQYGTSRVSVSEVLTAIANQKTIIVRDTQRDGTSVLNEAATEAAKEKAMLATEAFGRWIWEDDARRERLSRIYNDMFNTDQRRVYDGSNLTLPGKVGDDVVKLRPHQLNGVWRIIQSNTTLLDHVVGAGKTFTMIAGAMELRRMGLAKKPMFVVPNHLVGQWAADFTRLYPGASVLATTKEDFGADKRKVLFARIATGDWDAVIVAHTSFGKVEVEPAAVAAFIEEQIADLQSSMNLVAEAEGKKSRNVKQIQKQIDARREKMKKLLDTQNKDDSLYWGELGVDALFVDEAHEFKNLAFSSGMQRVAGLGNQAGSQKASDMFIKTRQVLAATGGRNIVFATGTPISNTMAEMFTMQRYLDYRTMGEQGLTHFDAWARMFGEVVTDWELSPAGTYKINSRFKKFVNMAELIQRYSSFSDTVNRDDINAMLAAQGKRLPVPKVKGGKPENVVVDRSPDQARFIGEPIVDPNGNESYPPGSLIFRAENLRGKAQKGADNMLKIMSDARKAALDMRILNPGAADHPTSKVNEAARRIKALYDKWDADKGAQLVFIDLSTPKGAREAEAAAIRDLMQKAEDGDDAAQEKLDRMSPDEFAALDGEFSVYDDLRAKLIRSGIPAHEIAFIHDANTDLRKEELFAKVRSGRVRVLLGSTAKMGAGMNAQERLVALHHLDAPWRPSDLEQREGRIIRQGNALFDRDPEGFEVEILRYATKNTLDSRMWQTIEAKAGFIEQVRKGADGQREAEDVSGEAANAAEMKAASSGNPLVLEEMTLRQQVRQLENARYAHEAGQHRIRDSIRWGEAGIAHDRKVAGQLDADAKIVLPKPFAMTIDGKVIDSRKEAGEAILTAAVAMDQKPLPGIREKSQEQEVGKYGGFTVTLIRHGANTFGLEMRAAGEYLTSNFASDADPMGVAQRMTNAVTDLDEASARRKRAIEAAEKELPKLRSQVAAWPKADDLTRAKARHASVIEQLKPKRKPAPAPAATPAPDIGDVSLSVPDAAPVATLTGDEVQGEDIAARRRAARDWMNQNLRGRSFYSEALKAEVAVNKTSIGETLARAPGDRIVDGVPAIQALLERGAIHS